jgi:hypothetical protein
MPGVHPESVSAGPHGLERGALEDVPAAAVGFLEAGDRAQPLKSWAQGPKDNRGASPRLRNVEEATPGGRVAVHLHHEGGGWAVDPGKE